MIPTHSLQTSQQPEPEVPADFVLLCSNLQMGPCAASGWCRLSIHASSICCCYFSSSALCHASLLMIYVGRENMTSWQVLIPHMAIFLPALIVACGVWRQGPAFAGSTVSQMCNLVTAAGLVSAIAPVCIGPDSWIPYHDRLLSSALMAVAMLAAQYALVTGGSPLYHPPEPLSSLRGPLLTATNEAIINIDNMIDLQMTRVVFNQVTLLNTRDCSVVSIALTSHDPSRPRPAGPPIPFRPCHCCST